MAVQVTTTSLDSLPAEDVFFEHIFPRLEAADWISLLNTNRAMNSMTSSFLSINKVLSIARPLSTISPSMFKALTENATNLRTLNLSRCSWITDELLRPVLRNNNKLVCIDLSHCNECSEGILQVLTVQCPNISRLILRECKWVVPEALDYMAYHRNLNKQERTAPKTEDILLAMGKGLRTNLKSRAKSKYCGKEQLYLNLRVKKFKPKIKTNFQKMNPHILEVDLSGCEMLTDANIANFVSVFRHLQIFKIGNNSNISDSSMKSIATNLKNLHTLDINSCYKISNAGLFTIAKYCKKLKSVDIGSVQFAGYLLSFMQGKDISIIKNGFCNQGYPSSLHTKMTAGSSKVEMLDEADLGIMEDNLTCVKGGRTQIVSKDQEERRRVCHLED
eukprot:GFUD01013996.1.p1 GENE.GFUD01013996.1~~GFUD01013996.1.p1  ORF type:complete len:390 (+),score=72.30 GFUD01013996.1:80-1249(+)